MNRDDFKDLMDQMSQNSQRSNRKNLRCPKIAQHQTSQMCLKDLKISELGNLRFFWQIYRPTAGNPKLDTLALPRHVSYLNNCLFSISSRLSKLVNLLLFLIYSFFVSSPKLVYVAYCSPGTGNVKLHSVTSFFKASNSGRCSARALKSASLVFSPFAAASCLIAIAISTAWLM